MRALVLSGGANKGAYQAGVVYCFLHNLNIHYDILCGVSVGALNASLLATYLRGSERIAAEGLQHVWESIERDDLFVKWPLGLLQAPFKSSVFDSTPLRNLVRKYFDVGALRVSKKELRIGATCLDSGSYQLFTQADPLIQKAVMASCAIPGLFEPVVMNGKRWVDGGVREITPIKAAIDAGATSIDVVVTSPPRSVPFAGSEARSWEIALRAADVMADTILENDLQLARRVNALVELGKAPGKRRVILRLLQPKRILSADPLDFSRETRKALWHVGYEDARAFVTAVDNFVQG